MPSERKKDGLFRCMFLKFRPRKASQAADNNSASATSNLVPTVSPPLRANTLDPGPSGQGEAVSTQSKEPKSSNDVWATAFRRLQESDKTLAKAYANHLNPARGEDEAVFDVDFVNSAVKNLDKSRDEKQWRVAFAGKSIHVRSQVEKMVKFLLWTDAIVKPALSAQPYAALAWSAVSIFLPLMNAGTELHDAMLAGLEGINRMLVFWKISESSVYPFRSQARESFYRTFIDLHYLIIRYYARAVCHLSTSQLSRAWKSLAGGNDWVAEAKGINELSHTCQGYLKAAHRETFQEYQDAMNKRLIDINNSQLALKDISKSLQDIHHQYEDKEESNLLGSLSADYEGHKNVNPVRVPGTCQWLLKDSKFCQWREDRTSRLLWISAGPGYGKSVLTKCLIDEQFLQSPARVSTSSVCYFFFKDGDEKRTKAADAIAAILHQLFAQDLTGTLIKKAKTPFHNGRKTLRDSFDQLWRILQNCAASPDSGEIICVLDALDECIVSERERIIDSIGNFYTENRNSASPTSSLKFLITSRTHESIKSRMEKFCEPGKWAHVNGDNYFREIGEEIKVVIKHNLSHVAKGLPEHTSDLLAKSMAKVTNRTYLWLRLFFQVIERDPSAYKTPTSISDLFASLPSKVSDFYEEILEASTSKTSKGKQAAEFLLQFVLVTSENSPLRLQMADEALALALVTETCQWETFEDFRKDCWGENFESYLRNLTGFLVVVEHGLQGSRLSFLHQTFRDFLTWPEPTSSQWKGRFSPSQAKTTMFLCCMKALSVINRPCLRFVDGILDSFTDRLEYHLPGRGFLNHAVTRWPEYYESLSDDGKEKYYGQVRSLCDVTRPDTRDWMTYNPSWTHFITQTESNIRSLDGLSLAVLLGLAYVAEKMISTEQVDVNKVADGSVSPLQIASWIGNLKMVRLLVENKANIDDSYGGLGSPIECAIGRNMNVEVIKFLLAHSPAPKVRAETLVLAAKDSSGDELVQMLLQAFPDLEATESLLETAAGNESCADSLLDFLFKHYTDLRLPDSICLIAAKANPKALRVILDRRADIRITEEVVEAVVMRRNSLEVLQLLFEKQPELRITEKAMVRAASHGHNGIAITELFINKRRGHEIPEPVFCAAARNTKCGPEILQLLFTEQNATKVSSSMIREALGNTRYRDVLNIFAPREGFKAEQSDVESWFKVNQNVNQHVERIMYAAKLSGTNIELTAAIMKEVVPWADEVENFLAVIGSDTPFVVNDEVFTEWQRIPVGLIAQTERSMRLKKNEIYSGMKFLINAQGCRLQITGDEGTFLSREGVVDRLESRQRRTGLSSE